MYVFPDLSGIFYSFYSLKCFPGEKRKIFIKKQQQQQQQQQQKTRKKKKRAEKYK